MVLVVEAIGLELIKFGRLLAHHRRRFEASGGAEAAARDLAWAADCHDRLTLAYDALAFGVDRLHRRNAPLKPAATNI